MDNSIPKASGSMRAQNMTQESTMHAKAEQQTQSARRQIGLLSDADTALKADNERLIALYGAPTPTPEPDSQQQAALLRLTEQLQQPAMRGKAEQVLIQLGRIFDADGNL
jgi:hypothetical protein